MFNLDDIKKYGIYIEPITHIQARYLNDNEHRFFVIPSGRRSRKSLISAAKLRINAIEKPGRYFHGAPTRDQAKKIFWKRLKKSAELLGIMKRINETELSITIDAVDGESEIVVVGLDKPERIEGQPWDGCHITEFGNLKVQAWSENIRPVLSDTNGFAYIDGVPDYRSKNFANYLRLAERACNGVIPKNLPGVGAMAFNGEWAYYSWNSEDVLTPEEIESARDEYDERIYLQEYCGQFIQAGGSVYHSFTQDNIQYIEFDGHADTWLSYDFGVGQGFMSCLIIQEHGLTSYVIKEFFIQGSNTPEVTLMAMDYLEEHGFNGRLGVTGDYSGNTSQSVASVSDYMIIEQMIKQKYLRNFDRYHGGLGMKVTPTVSVKNRVNITNASFLNANKHKSLFVNPECKMLVDDLYKTVWKLDTTGESLPALEKSDPKRTHLSDTLSYYCMNNKRKNIKE